jgi:hypothetical protein
MRFTDYYENAGQVIAYNVGIRKYVTGTIPSALLLSQFLYWTGKSVLPDGWFYNSYADIQEATGLTDGELRGALGVLRELSLIMERDVRQKEYKVRLDVLNDLWDRNAPKKLVPIVRTGTIEDEFRKSSPEPKKSEPAKEKKDLVDGYLDAAKTHGSEKVKALLEFESVIATNFNINPSDRDWQDFFEYAYIRQSKHGEPFSKFILHFKGVDMTYWSAKRFKTMWPQAFVKQQEQSLDLIDVPVVKLQDVESEVVPMPEDFDDF